MENYGTIEKTIVLWTKLWYYTENYRTSIYEEKNKYEHAYDDKGSEPGQIYLPVGFLSPLPVPQTEEMYEKLNRDRSYRSSYIPATVRQRESIKETLPTF